VFPVILALSVGLATTLRIGNLLGEGNGAAARVAGRA
jgi:Na+-driven multidrug efflux pump